MQGNLIIARSRVPYLWGFVGVFVVQGVLVAWQFPLSELLTITPILHIDHGFHWYQVDLTVRLWRQHDLVGYDPTFAAGQVPGPTLDVAVPAFLAALADPFVPPVVIYKLYVLTAALAAPLVVVVAATWARLSASEAVLSGLLAVLLWWASYLHWYHTAGMVAFVLASFLALPYAVAVASFVEVGRPARGRSLLLGVCGGLGLYLHPHFPVIALLMLLPMIVGALRPSRILRTLRLGLPIAVVAVLVMLPWILALHRYDTAGVGAQPYQKAVDLTLIPKYLAGVWGHGAQGAKINIALGLATAAAAILSVRRRPAVLAAIVGWLALSLLGAVGAAFEPLAVIQPNRLLLSAYVCLLLPAAIGVKELWARVIAGPPGHRGFAFIVALLILGPLAYSCLETVREVRPGAHGRYGDAPPEVEGAGPQTRWMLSWLAANTTTEARVLFEMSHARIHDGSHIAGYLAGNSHREFIGGPYPYKYEASAWDGVAFGRALDELPAQEFDRYLETYNVGWIIAHSEGFKRYLQRIPNVQHAGDYMGVDAYRVERKLTYVLEGSGRVDSASLNRIVFSGMSGDRAVIAYHYAPGLAATPSNMSLAPVVVPGITQPMIGITGSSAGPITITFP